MYRLLIACSLAACTGQATVTAGPAAPPPAQPAPVVVAAPASHPAYHRALADLRHASLYLRRPSNAQVAWDEKRAVDEIAVAMREIREAAIEDEKNPSDAGPADTMVWGDRLHRALELLESAKRDLSAEEDNAWANGLKARSLGHVDKAINWVREGIADASHAPPPVVVVAPPPGPAQHPAYLHALSDLRYARFLLEKPAKPLVKWDEAGAIREIDAAISEIKGAAIDDGKPLAEHPAPDAAWDHHGRLRKALELLEQSARDIEQKEDNAFARGLRARANGHINNAIKFVREASRDARHH
jgi:hypothetical protein